MSWPPSDPKREATRLRAALDHLAETLYQADSDPDVAFIKSQPGVLGTEIASAADRLWSLYPLATDALEQLDAAVQHRDTTMLARLFGPEAVALPDGTTSGIEALIASLQADTDTVLTRSHDAAGAARESLTRLDAIGKILNDLDTRARSLALDAVPELDVAHRQLDAATRQLAADPLGHIDLGPADAAVAIATAAVEALVARHMSLPDRLANAHVQLDELAQLIPDGAEALAETGRKISEPGALLEALDPGVLDGDERSLRPWLARIAAQASDGAWMTADAGLARWKLVADGCIANAREVLDANRRPLVRRNELRGLLESYRAKAAASGRGEDPELDRLHRAAHDLLWSAPCDLQAAELRVRGYVEAITTSHAHRETEDRR
jgi:hypothetical protein